MKAVPKFKSEDEERAYWESHDSTEHVDWTQARKVTLQKKIQTKNRSVLELKESLLPAKGRREALVKLKP